MISASKQYLLYSVIQNGGHLKTDAKPLPKTTHSDPNTGGNNTNWRGERAHLKWSQKRSLSTHFRRTDSSKPITNNICAKAGPALQKTHMFKGWYSSPQIQKNYSERRLTIAHYKRCAYHMHGIKLSCHGRNSACNSDQSSAWCAQSRRRCYSARHL